MARNRAHRLWNICRVVLGQRATNSASQVRNSSVGPKMSARALETYQSSLLPYWKPRLLLMAGKPGMSTQMAPMELYRSEVRSPTAPM